MKKSDGARLLKLADFLEQLPRRRFNYSSWVGTDWGGKSDLSCGTTACAVGWASTLQIFRRRGLRLLSTQSGNLPVSLISNNVPDVFGLSQHECCYLFLPYKGEEYMTAKQVAKKIRNFVKANGIPPSVPLKRHLCPF